MCHGYIFNSILREHNINWKLLHENSIEHKKYLPARTPTCQMRPGCHYATVNCSFPYRIYAMGMSLAVTQMLKLCLTYKEN